MYILKKMNRKRLIIAIDIVSVLVIVLMSFQLAKCWCGQGSCQEILAEKAVFEKEDAGEKSLKYYLVIEKKNLFGKAKSYQSESGKHFSAAGFRLKGTVILDSGKGYAILENLSSGVQELYRLGDMVENSTLAQIEWGNVILDGSDGEKILTFANLLPANTAGEQKNGKEEEKKDAVLQTVKDKRVIPRSLVQGAITDANRILTEVRVKPYLISGISAGYWVGNIKPGSIVEQMGFENGDIVKKVNGQILDSPEKIFQVYQKIQATGTVCVEVERNNQLEILEYEIRD